ncbi:MAG: hypothetical protein KGJ80_04010 [Chloroflexota bacterium]|nr:hypothetical protein [Chloroflexota bacterium]
MKRVRVDWDGLELAFNDASGMADYFLDTETGEVVMISDAAMSADEVERIRDMIDADDSGRFVRVPRNESGEGYEDMEEFVATVPNARARDLLQRAIRGRGAFRRFKDTLVEFPKERERWFRFQDERLRERIREWLEEEKIEPD